MSALAMTGWTGPSENALVGGDPLPHPPSPAPTLAARAASGTQAVHCLLRDETMMPFPFLVRTSRRGAEDADDGPHETGDRDGAVERDDAAPAEPRALAHCED